MFSPVPTEGKSTTGPGHGGHKWNKTRHSHRAHPNQPSCIHINEHIKQPEERATKGDNLIILHCLSSMPDEVGENT